MKYIAKRLLALAGILLASSFAVFGGLYLAPGSPEQFLVQGRTVSAEVLASIREQYNLDDPFLTRYVSWVGNALQGDFSHSLSQNHTGNRLHILSGTSIPRMRIVFFKA